MTKINVYDFDSTKVAFFFAFPLRPRLGLTEPSMFVRGNPSQCLAGLKRGADTPASNTKLQA